MTSPSPLNSVVVGTFVFLASATALQADTLVMPRELVDFAHANGCAPIDDFYERPGMVSPPYPYGWLAGDPESSAVFWCKKLEKSDRPYLLLIKATNANDLSGCPPKIDYWNGPAGLSIETRKRFSLSDFAYVAEPRRAGPAVVIPLAKVIVDYYDGLSSTFYCYKGQWFVDTSPSYSVRPDGA
jgi:hypothetical protein